MARPAWMASGGIRPREWTAMEEAAYTFHYALRWTARQEVSDRVRVISAAEAGLWLHDEEGSRLLRDAWTHVGMDPQDAAVWREALLGAARRPSTTALQ
eukprot:2395402-Alexandrium_andersonii.AAC.1